MARMVLTHTSQALGQETDITIITPQQEYLSSIHDFPVDSARHEGWKKPFSVLPPQRPGVLYLLHGLNGNHSVWNTYSRLDRLAQHHQLIIVCPSGYRSFWINQTHGLHVHDWVVEELPELIRHTFHIDTSRARTFIGGMSMGGYGAMYLALHHPHLYGGAFSLSGVLDVRCTQGRKSLQGFYDTSVQTDNIAGSGYDLIHLLDTIKGQQQESIRPSQEFSFASNHHNDQESSDKAHEGERVSSAYPQLAILCGKQDDLLSHSYRFEQYARAAGLTVFSRYSSGRHDYDYWTPALYEAMTLLDER